DGERRRAVWPHPRGARRGESDQNQREAATGKDARPARVAGAYPRSRRHSRAACDADSDRGRGSAKSALADSGARLSTGLAAGGPAGPNGVYVVQNGDTLSDIATKVGLSEDELLKINGIRNRDLIFEGQQLTVKPGQSLPAGVT